MSVSYSRRPVPNALQREDKPPLCASIARSTALGFGPCRCKLRESPHHCSQKGSPVHGIKVHMVVSSRCRCRVSLTARP